MNKRPLRMTISLNALEHLGINLYSNIPAVLSEIVANSWDADATKVKIALHGSTESIVIQDDGIGMTRDGVIDRFLTVGFRRRDELGDKTLKGRRPMGRKGIGKLSIFSIANVAEVYTVAKGEKTAFKMARKDIEAAIKGKGEANYEPEELDNWPDNFGTGTRIVLSNISKSLKDMTVKGLRRRVARRFSVIGPSNNFSVSINGSMIQTEDRGYYPFLQYIWTYGDQACFVELCKKLERDAVDRLSNIQCRLDDAGLSLLGWIGTVKRPEHLKDEEGDNLNRLAVFMRGKMAQEDILDGFGQKEIYANYVVGELHCEELDVDGEKDIATSSRQSLKEDDPRFEALRDIVLSELRHIAGVWSDWRRSDGAKIAVEEVPAVSDWLGDLQGDTKKKAERWIGRLNTIRSEDRDKRELLKASILAFESYRRKESLDMLENFSDVNLEDVLKVFYDIDDLELSYYGQIVKNRLQVIKTLEEKLEENDKELVLRNYIFNHLWLLDPSWERAKGSETVEKKIGNFLKENTKTLESNKQLSQEERKGRIDIGYRTVTGKHVIVELKRASVAVPVDRLVAQVRKYRDGARKILSTTDYAQWPIEIICVLGKAPPEWNNSHGTGRQDVIASLKAVDARIVFYDQLLTSAKAAYDDYLQEHIKKDNLWNVFEAIDDFTPPAPNT